MLTQHYCLTCSLCSNCTVAPGLLCVRVPAPGSRAVHARHGSSVSFHVSFVTPESGRVVLQKALPLGLPRFRRSQMWQDPSVCHVRGVVVSQHSTADLGSLAEDLPVSSSVKLLFLFVINKFRKVL